MGKEESDRLAGWKDIAAFFGRSVRAVQRWEEQLGLPVHRIKTVRGATVYAFREELTAWQTQVDPARLDETVSPQSRTSQTVSPARWVAIAGLTAVVIVSAAITWTLRGRSAPAVASVRLNGRSLQAVDNAGRVLWSHTVDFDGRLGYEEHQPFRPVPVLTDTDNDGDLEVVVVIRTGPLWADVRHGDVMLCFTSTGKLRWKFSQSDLPYTFDGQRFEGPTRFLAWMTDDAGAVWIAVNHHTWWPTALVRLDSKGQATTHYVHSGGLYALRPWSIRGRSLVVAGGINNEYRQAALTVIDPEAPLSTSPQTSGRGFHCDNCPSNGPEAFLLLPRTELNRLSGDAYNNVDNIVVVGDQLKIVTREQQDAMVLHMMNADYRIAYSDVLDRYWDRHAALAAAGGILHSEDECPDRQTIRHVGIWTRAEGWIARPRF